MTPYKTIKGVGAQEYTVEKSVFIGYVTAVDDEKGAQDFIQDIRSKHNDARHVVHAYIINSPTEMKRFSDDKEPMHTAGFPILQWLESQGLTQCCVAVVRYFGGVLLGKGGLIRAYTKAAQLAVESAGIITKDRCDLLTAEVPYEWWGSLQYYFEQNRRALETIDYGEKVSIRLWVRAKETESVQNDILNHTNGDVVTDVIGREIREVE